MNKFSPLRVLGLATLGLGLFAFAGCSQRTQAVDSQVAESQSADPHISLSQNAPSQTTTREATTAELPKTELPKADLGKKPAEPQKINWQPSLTAALNEAKRTQKPIMIDFYATWCPPCKMLDQVIYPAEPVVEQAKNFVNVKIDVDKHQDLMVKYRIEGMPTIVFLDAGGREIHRSHGISDQVEWFVGLMQEAQAKVAPTAA